MGYVVAAIIVGFCLLWVIGQVAASAPGCLGGCTTRIAMFLAITVGIVMVLLAMDAVF